MRKQQASQYGAWTLNFTLRFLYEFFLEVCICVAISLAAHKVNTGREWTITFFLGLIILAIVGFLVTLLWRGGPYTEPNSYKKHSLAASFWGKRALCQEYCAPL